MIPTLNWTEALFLPMAAQLAAIALLLLLARENRPTNRLMAAWLLVVTGLILPYILTYAGLYRSYSLLWFAPFSLPLLLGPILLAFVQTYTRGTRPPRMPLHVAPAAADAGYQLFCWIQAQAWKEEWAAAVHLPYVKPLVGAAALLSLVAYLCWSLVLLRRYRSAGVRQLREARQRSTSWLQRVLLLLLALMTLRGAFEIADAFRPAIGHEERFGFYLLLTVLSLYAALESGRRACDEIPGTEASLADTDAAARLRRSTQAEKWAAQVREGGHWRDPELSLPKLAARLGTNTHDLSRAFNEGLGLGFPAFINRLRLEEVAAELGRPHGKALLTIAFDCGFNSKATFNRAFRAHFGLSPSEYRSKGRVEGQAQASVSGAGAAAIEA